MKRLLLILLSVLLAFSCTAVFAFAEEAKEEVKDEAIDVKEDLAKTVNDLNEKLNDLYHIEGLTITSVSVSAGEENALIINGIIIDAEKEETDEKYKMPWSHKYVISEEQYLQLFHANGDSVLVYESGKTEMSADTAALIGTVIDSSVDDLGVNLDFNPAGFIRNIKYMGLGMLGIFVVVGVVILLTFVLNKVTGRKAN